MDYQTILLSKRDGVATLMLNRPERRNAFNMKMIEELLDALRDIAEDDAARVLILAGAGKAFCSGTDFQFREQREGRVTPEIAEEARPIAEALKRGRFRHGLTEIVLGLRNLEKPTIAMVDGDAVGAGFDFALACDIRFASPRARFVVGFTRVAVPPVTGTAWFLPRLVGVNRALEMIYTGDWLSAERAEELGILNRLLPAESLVGETEAFASRLAAGPPIAYRLAKHLVYGGLNVDLDASLMQSMAAIGLASQSEDHYEALSAMVAKRPPSYRDR